MLSNVLKFFKNLRLGVLINSVLLKKKCTLTTSSTEPARVDDVERVVVEK